MGRLLLGAAVAAVLGVVNLTGKAPAPAAAGGSEKPSAPPGQQQTPPGQSGKPDGDRGNSSPPGQQTPPGQSATTEESAAPDGEAEADAHGDDGPRHGAPAPDPTPAHGTSRSPGSPESAEPARSGSPQQDKEKPAAAAQPARSSPAKRASSAPEHVIICHRTGSERNPYVVINVSIEAWLHGHASHPDLNGRSDILLKQGAEPGEKLPVSACSDPGGNATTEPTRTTPRGDPAPAGTTTVATAATADPTSLRASPAANEYRDPQTRQSAARYSGAAARLSRTAVRGTLPFTGVPLWIAILAASALLGSGLALRRAGLYWSGDGR